MIKLASDFIPYRSFLIACLGVMGLVLGGCTTAINTQLKPAPITMPIKILVMQAPITIGASRLQAVLAPDSKPTSTTSEELISLGVKRAQEHALAAMESALDQESKLVVITPLAEENQLTNNIQGQALESVITQDEANRIQAATGADALLRFSITDYGLTPRSWRNGFIAFEVTTTLALAGVIAFSNSPAAKAAAGIYLVQEAIEETATAYAGFWALDEVCRPVRIEAELILLNPVSTRWKTSDTGLSDLRLSRLIRKIEANERDGQLDEATNDVVKHIAADLSGVLENTKP